MPRKPKEIHRKVTVPEWMEIVDSNEEYAIVKMHIGDLERIRLMKLPEEYRAYRREIQKKYRDRLKLKEEKA